MKPLRVSGGVDGVFASNDSQGLGHCSLLDSISNWLGDELEDVWPDSAGGRYQPWRFHRPPHPSLYFEFRALVTLNGEGLLSFLTNFCYCVALGVVDLVNEAVDDIDEDNVVASLVEKLGNEATTDVATTEVNGGANHGCDAVVGTFEGESGVESARRRKSVNMALSTSK